MKKRVKRESLFRRLGYSGIQNGPKRPLIPSQMLQIALNGATDPLESQTAGVIQGKRESLQPPS